jgi:hypothetical protein
MLPDLSGYCSVRKITSDSRIRRVGKIYAL